MGRQRRSTCLFVPWPGDHAAMPQHPEVGPPLISPQLLLAYHYILQPGFVAAVRSPGMSFNLILAGAMAYRCGPGRSGVARAGSLVVFTPGPVRYEAVGSEPLVKYGIYFQIANPPLAGGIPVLPGLGPLPDHLELHEDLAAVEQACEAILQSIAVCSATWQLRSSSAMVQLLAMLFERATAGRILTPMRRDRWDLLLARIDTTPDLPTVQELAREFGISAPQFIRDFHHRFGRPPKSYMLDRRLDLARQDLLGGSAVKQAAHRRGFRSLPHFSRLFRARFGHPPSQTHGDAHLRLPIQGPSLPSCRHFFAPGIDVEHFPPLATSRSP